MAEMNSSLDELIEKAADIILKAGYVMALTGAGMSVESGIPPFRGPGGIWTQHGEPPLDMYQRFLQNPRKAWEERLNPRGPMAELARALRMAEPNPGHFALAELEAMDILKSIITQNIDNLHQEGGSRNVLEIHGNASLLRCIECNLRYQPEDVSTDEIPPTCPSCKGLLKSDTVFFGEPIPLDILELCESESEKCDCMIVAGTSATVYPAAAFPRKLLRNNYPVIEINPYESELTRHCRISLKGPSGEVLPLLVDLIRNKMA